MKKNCLVTLFIFLFIIAGVLTAEKLPLNFESNSLKKNYKELISYGHKLYEEGAFLEALNQFEQASHLRQSISHSLRYRMALLHHILKEETRVIELLQSKSTLKKIPETHYLIALSYKELGQYQLAERHLRHYLDLPNPKHHDEAILELAGVLFLQEKFTHSCSLLESLSATNREERVLLALSKTLIWQGKVKRAEHILRENVFSAENLPLYAYLMGKIAENRGDFETAINFFSEAKNVPNQKQAEWRAEILESEVHAYLFLANDWGLPASNRLDYLAKATDPLKELYQIQGPNSLSFAFYWTTWANLIGDPIAEPYLKTVMMTTATKSPKSLYLRAQMARTHEEKVEIYKLLTSGPPHDPYVLRGWYMRGQNDLVLGELNRACFAFEQVWKTCRKENPKLASRAIQAQLETYLVENSRKALKQAINLIEHTEPLEDPDSLYLQGLAFFRDGRLDQAKEVWKKVLMTHQDHQSALFALGSLYYQKQEWAEAEQHFLKLRDPSLLPEALSLAAKCQKYLGRDPKDIQTTLIETFPESPYGAQAYLNLFSQQEYIKGNPDAVNHLKAFHKKFPKSQWGIEAYYLLGLNAKRDHYTSSGKLLRCKDFDKSVRYLQKASDLHDTLSNLGRLEHDHDYFFALRTQASIERALVNLEIADSAKGTKKQIYLEYTADLLKSLIEGLANASIVEECRFTLGTTYEKMGDDAAAETIYNQMLQNYQEAKITRGVYLARTHYQLGMMHKRKSQVNQALNHFTSAEDAAKGKVLSSDQYLEVLIQQSLCLMDQDEDDRAMVVLSKVINQDVASSLRLKAMFLRSHIYQKQHRDELAFRQLEALAKQQGEWAEKAKKELAAYEY